MKSIVRISETVSIAFHMMAVLSIEPDKNLLAQEIADTLGLKVAYPQKILSKLSDAGLVVSSRGRGGGYRLSKHPSEISLLDIFESFEGMWERVSCVQNNKICDDEHAHVCFFGGLVGQMHDKMHKFLLSTTLETISTERFI